MNLHEKSECFHIEQRIETSTSPNRFCVPVEFNMSSQVEKKYEKSNVAIDEAFEYEFNCGSALFGELYLEEKEHGGREMEEALMIPAILKPSEMPVLEDDETL